MVALEKTEAQGWIDYNVIGLQQQYERRGAAYNVTFTILQAAVIIASAGAAIATALVTKENAGAKWFGVALSAISTCASTMLVSFKFRERASMKDKGAAFLRNLSRAMHTAMDEVETDKEWIAKKKWATEQLKILEDDQVALSAKIFGSRI